MDVTGKNSEDAGARQFELNVEAPEKPVEPIPAERGQGLCHVVEAAPDAAQKKRDEELDTWMKNVREFIRNIDVKSL